MHACPDTYHLVCHCAQGCRCSSSLTCHSAGEVLPGGGKLWKKGYLFVACGPPMSEVFVLLLRLCFSSFCLPL